ncbi:placenta growth factor isoform X1 [Anser cygnoides]|uniref:placenta growth factor isoform X2 n=1 Tax=Cygnus atratus TaxID=8868 RepID=UPI0015D64E19|nr:placenta growth factor isoform X2 [Cygnus atratus]XP_040415469.1 placenta growth factor isoform X2 [Cygnus olor]
MRLLGAFLRLLLAGALGAPPAPAPEARGTASAEAPVLTFKEIWNRSFCRPLEQLVDVIAEFPNEVEYIFRPSCVALQRCGGCCGDEGLRCVPVETSTVTMQLLKIKPNGEAPYVEMSFTEHKKCECRPRQDLVRLGRRRPKGRDVACRAGSLRSAPGLAPASGA